ncbi:CHC2 zinc finger domain-containing protein, partial [Faecalibacterium duncaniae]
MKVDSRFHCFACQADGDVIDFVGRLFQLSPYKAVEKLKEDFGMALADGKVRLAPRRPPTVRQQLLD